MEGTEYTKQRAEWYKVSLQGKDETDQAFRERVSGSLRDMGHTIEAHEAYHNCLYDDRDARGYLKMRKMLEKFGGVLCAMGLHSWGLISTQDEDEWNRYVALWQCRRCQRKRFERCDMTDQMTGI